MSTCYDVRAPKRHLTTNRLWELFQSGKIKLEYDSGTGRPRSMQACLRKIIPVTKKSQITGAVCLQLGNNYAWFYQHGRVWHSFTRYGSNVVDEIIDFIRKETGGRIWNEYGSEEE